MILVIITHSFCFVGCKQLAACFFSFFFIFSNWLLQTTGCPARPLLHHCHKVRLSHSEPPSPGLVVMRMMALMLTMLMAMVMMMVSVVVVVCVDDLLHQCHEVSHSKPPPNHSCSTCPKITQTTYSLLLLEIVQNNYRLGKH